MKTHKFDVEDAQKYGVKKAIILEHLKYHQESNYGNPDYMLDGKSYAHIKQETIKKMFPYLNYKSVKRWLKELENEQVIESQKPGKSTGTHTLLYHVTGHSYPRFKRREGFSQNEKSNSQNEKSARDIDECARKSQNEKSSLVTMCNKPRETRASEDPPNSGQPQSPVEAGFKKKNGPPRINGCPVPDELAEVDGFTERFEFYLEYLKENSSSFPSAKVVELKLEKLAYLQRQGNYPVAVINQTIDGMNKSFYPLRNFEKNKGSRDSFDPTGIANAGMYTEYVGD